MDLGRVVTGKTPPTKQRKYYGGEFPFITPSDLDFDTYRIQSTETTLSIEARMKFGNQFIPKNTITYTCIASVGKIGVATTDSLTNQQINSIIVNDHHDWRFVYYLLRDKTRLIQAMCSGVSSPIFNKGHFEKLEIIVPTELSVERGIGAILSSYDDLIENNRQRIGLLEQMTWLLYKEWFFFFRFPGYENITITDGVPEGWERKTIGDIVEVSKGQTITNNSAREGSVPVVAGGKTPAYYHDTANAVGPVITVSGSGANAGYVNMYHEDIWASDCSYISGISIDYLHYLFHVLKSKQEEITQFQIGSAQPHVYSKDLKQLQLNVPTETILGLFSQFVLPIYSEVGQLLKQNNLLVQSRDLLQPRLVSGEAGA